MNAPPRYPPSIPHHARSDSESQPQSLASHHQGREVPPHSQYSLYSKYEEPSPPDTVGSSSYAIDHFEVPPPKRQRLSGPTPNYVDAASAQAQANSFPRNAIASPPDSGNSLNATARRLSTGVAAAALPPTPTTAVPATTTTATTPATTGKSKRVRTGCLTCRKRHLKCDEGVPDCNNCRKSNRECTRGIRLNFIDYNFFVPPVLLSPTVDWSVQFKDESRLIASEYQDGLARYAPFDRVTVTPTPPQEVEAATASRQPPPPAALPSLQHQQQQHVLQPQQETQHQSRGQQDPELSQGYAPYDMGSGTRDYSRQQPNYGSYYQGRSQQPDRSQNNARLSQPDYQAFDHVQPQIQQQRDIVSRRSSDAYAPMNRPQQQQQQPQMMQMQPTQPMQQQAAYYGGQFSLAALQEQLSTGDDGTRQSHSHKSSDMSSVTSSLVPQHAGPASQSFFRPPYPPGQQAPGPQSQDGTITPPSEKTTGEKDYLNSEEEIFYMQVFISEVAIWMDSLDHLKHFSRVVPYLALKSEMLLNAVLSCGVKHLELTNPSLLDVGGGGGGSNNTNTAKVLQYYDTATTLLLRSLQNPDRNMAECATTAAVLNVYEIMSEKPQGRRNHIAGARALIRECGWDASSTGIASACFWLNVGMEILSCLAFDWKMSWEPDQWNLDVSALTPDGSDAGPGSLSRGGGLLLEHNDISGGSGTGTGTGTGTGDTGNDQPMQIVAHNLGGQGEEEAWVHRIFYVVAKIANFRANIPRFQQASPHDEQVRLQSRFAEWKRLKAMCDTWNNNCPRPMRPFGYSPRPSSKSLFPIVMLIRRAAVVGRLFYHTAMCLLAQINPLEPSTTEENRAAQLHHAHQVCGIVAHTKDHGVSSVAIRSLAIAAGCLVDLDEQKEVLDILNKITKETGWRLGSVLNELKTAWRWGNEGESTGGGVTKLPTLGPPPYQQGGGGYGVGIAAMQQQQMMMPMPRPVNPLLAKADFNRPDHPYQNWYRPPNGQNAGGAPGYWAP